MEIQIRQAQNADSQTVHAILHEAARWLEEKGEPLWKADEITKEQIAADVNNGDFYIAESEGKAVGVMKFQLEDRLFWPDVPVEEATFVHRFAIRRAFAGQQVSIALLNWAVQRTRELERPFLRLDCEAARPKLRAVYENFGFRHHSDRQVGPYFVARYEFDCRNGQDENRANN